MANLPNKNLDEDISLKEYLEKILDERDRLYDTRFKSSEIAVAAALAAQEKAVAAAFLASEKAIVKAEDAQKDYNTRSNEFRGQLDDQAKTLMPRLETDTRFKAMEEKIFSLGINIDTKLDNAKSSTEKTTDGIIKDVAGLRESRSQNEGHSLGANALWGYIVGGIGIAIGIYTFFSKIT